MEVTHTAIPEDELKVFKSLKNVRTVFDVGARDDVDYLIIKPNIKLHAFEPNLEFFEQLKNNIGDRPNVYLNPFGLGDKEGTYLYDSRAQSIGVEGHGGVEIRTLYDYINEHKIKKIDFLKIDVEGFEWNVLRGMKDRVKICRYIQYEKNSNLDKIEELLRSFGFQSYYTGYSNQIAVRAGEKMPWIPVPPKEGGLVMKTDKNYLWKS